MGSMSKLERGLLAVLALWSLAPLAILFVPLPGRRPTASGRGMFTGSDGLQLADHLQYIAWIRDAGEHVLFSNRFDVVTDPHLFLHPMWALSGLAWSLGASLQLAFIGWKPIGVAVLFAGYALYARRMLPGSRRAQAATLALALFYVPTATWLTDWAAIGNVDLQFGSLIIGLELFPAGLLWEIVPTAIALGLMPLFLLGVERLLEPERRASGRSLRWYAGWTAVAGLLTAWLHPWQGLTLLVMVAGLVAWSRFRRDCLRLAVPVLGIAAPLAYFWALTRTDSAWHTVSRPNDLLHVGSWLYASLGPTLLLALPGLRRPEGAQERLLLLWPPAALAVYFALDSSFFYHALAGLTLPLAVLGVRGWRRLRLPPAAAVAAVLALTVPGMVFVLDKFRRDAPARFLTADETAAVAYLRDANRPGAVIAPLQLGQALPAYAGRNTFVGHPTWTPDKQTREAQAEALFSGRLPAEEARGLVRATGVTFLASDCRHRTDLEPLLRGMLASTRHFGCATVYELRR